MKNWIVNNFWIKVVSLILAIIAWFYVNGELDKESQISRKYYKSSFMKHTAVQPAAEKKPMNKGYIMEKEQMPKLGVNVDHVATLREARGGNEPDPVWAASVCEKAGCDSIVAHLREDRRHMNDRDIRALKKSIRTMFNLEMSINPEIVKIAKKILPHQATIVPERRQELTTEGGLSVVRHKRKISKVVDALRKAGIEVSIFIDPNKHEISAAKNIGVDIIEIHTGKYSLVRTRASVEKEFNRIKESVYYALSLGIVVNAGHGLNYSNVKKIAMIDGINELNIGHSIISRAVFAGIYKAAKDMKGLIG